MGENQRLQSRHQEQQQEDLVPKVRSNLISSHHFRALFLLTPTSSTICLPYPAFLSTCTIITSNP